MSNYDFIGFSFNNGKPYLTVMGGRNENEIILEWFAKQDHVFENVNGEWKQLSKEEFVLRYDSYVEKNVKKILNDLKTKEEKLLKELEKYNNFKQEFLK